uniref:Uncharacterized protein n=1 Tax=Zelkova schneideriana TaxID=172643 RepID=A0A8F1N786_9ROSA|nr:hypothetical protein [Zelkova schneideriana]
MIRRRDAKADRLVQLYLSWFSISRVVHLYRKISMATFESIFERCSSYSGVMSICSELTTRFHHLQKTYLPWISEIPVYQGISWVPTRKLLPNSPKCRRGLKEKGSTERKEKRVVSSFPALKYELAAFARHTRVELESMGIIPTGLLWESRVRFALYRESPSMLNSDISNNLRPRLHS